MDALLYALLKSLGYSSTQKRATLERMGSEMTRYLVETGTVPSPDRPEEFARSLRRLIIKNGYGSKAPMQFRAESGVTSPPGLVEVLARAGRPPGGRASRASGAPRRGGRVDWILYEAVLYSMTKVLDDQLGVQAQIILDQIGTSMLDYLLEAGAIKKSDDPAKLIQNVIDYFVKAGYTKSFRFELEGAPPDTFVSRYQSARYYTTVYRRIQKEGSALLSCPLCLIGHSVWATQGWRFGNIFELRVSRGGDVVSRVKIYPSTERFTEKDALRLSQMKA